MISKISGTILLQVVSGISEYEDAGITLDREGL